MSFGNCQTVCKPGSVPLRVAIIHLVRRSPLASCDQPKHLRANPHAFRRVFLLGLAPDGVYHASFVTKKAVRSYRTFSPLPLKAVCFLWHFP